MEPTIVSTGTGGIAVAYDYSTYLERIATALETIVELVTPTPIQKTFGSGISQVTFTGNHQLPLETNINDINIVVEPPETHNGVTAILTATVVTGPYSVDIANVSIVNAGSGYINPPKYAIRVGTTTVYTNTTVLKFNPNLFTAVGNIATNIEDLKTISTTTGIRAYNAYDWIKPLEMISWYSQGYGLNQYSTTETNKLVSIINSFTNQISKFE